MELWGGGVNVIQTIIGGESEWLTEVNTTKTIALTDDINNYDYLVIVLEFRRGTSTSYENNTVLARVGYTNGLTVDHSIGSDASDGTYMIKVSVSVVGTSAVIYQGARGSAYSGARIKQVIGVKFTKNLDNATSLDETVLYTGTDKTSTNKSYTISETLTQNSYDYLIVQLSGFGSGGGFSTGGTFIMTWENNRLTPSWYGAYSFEESNSNTMNGVVVIDGSTLYFYPSSNSTVGFQCINKVIGIKKNSLSTADIAEMAMPSDVYMTLTADSSGNVVVPANGYLQVIYDIVTNNISSVGLDDYVALIPAGFNGSTDCGTELYAVSKGKTTKLSIAAVLSGHYTVKFIYSIGSAKALGLV